MLPCNSYTSSQNPNFLRGAAVASCLTSSSFFEVGVVEVKEEDLVVKFFGVLLIEVDLTELVVEALDFAVDFVEEIDLAGWVFANAWW